MCYNLPCRYEMVFKQAVSAEDVFLGMGAKNPTTASCEDLVVSSTHQQLLQLSFPHCLR